MTAGSLPAPFRSDLLLLAERDDWADARVVASAAAALLVRTSPQGDVLMSRGEPAEVLDLLDAEGRLRRRTGAERALWLSAPRGLTVPSWVLDALGLVPFSHWDWMAREPDADRDSSPVAALPDGYRIRVIDTAAEAEAVRDVLRRTNPRSTADPLADREDAWSGAYDGDELVGVFGARREQGHGEHGFSWHLHGLGVLESRRGAGLGGALTEHLTRAGFAAGADWVSLGLYAENDGARRLYRRAGFELHAAMSSYGPATATRPLR